MVSSIVIGWFAESSGDTLVGPFILVTLLALVLASLDSMPVVSGASSAVPVDVMSIGWLPYCVEDLLSCVFIEPCVSVAANAVVGSPWGTLALISGSWLVAVRVIGVIL